MKRLLFLLTSLLLLSSVATAQLVVTERRDTVNTDSIRRQYDRGPYFGAYKDNYFVFGTSVGPRPTKQNSNVKFQISISQKLTRTTLPWHTYLYLFYTQKVFWNVLENSMPMSDLNFNPGIGLAKPLFDHSTGRYIGKAMLVIEHESNGRDGVESRSWNRITLGGNILLDRNIMVHAKAWIPIIDGMNNKDILKYCGIFQSGMEVMSNDRRWRGSMVTIKRSGWNLNFNVVLELCYRFFKNDNQYFFMQYYNGYGEGLLEYNRYHSEIRVGLCLKPPFFSDF